MVYYGHMMINLLTAKQLAAELNVTVRTINRYVKEGMPLYRISARKAFFDPQEVTEWIKQQARSEVNNWAKTHVKDTTGANLGQETPEKGGL